LLGDLTWPIKAYEDDCIANFEVIHEVIRQWGSRSLSVKDLSRAVDECGSKMEDLCLRHSENRDKRVEARFEAGKIKKVISIVNQRLSRSETRHNRIDQLKMFKVMVEPGSSRKKCKKAGSGEDIGLMFRRRGRNRESGKSEGGNSTRHATETKVHERRKKEKAETGKTAIWQLLQAAAEARKDRLPEMDSSMGMASTGMSHCRSPGGQMADGCSCSELR
jgi:hypothetical protein